MFLFIYVFILLSLITILSIILLLFNTSVSLYAGYNLSILDIYFCLLEAKVNEYNLACWAMLIFCGCLALHFSKHYFGWEQNNLNQLMLLFILVMLCLVVTNGFYSSLVFWEYLGFVSFLLILYYQNFDTFRASVITLITSRIGDVGFFLILPYLFVFGYFVNDTSYLLMLALFVFIGSKSAIVPMSSWLLEAMRAPTPISCLVHSSTLVAAGIWILLNYGWDFNILFFNFIYFFSVVSIIFSGVSAMFFDDLKKIIALSTCNNISWCVLYYCLGYEWLCIAQLVTHGLGKCMLFMCIGDLLSSSSGNQSINNISSAVTKTAQSNLIFMFILVIAIAGFPYQGVFFSKHLLIISTQSNVNVLLMLSLFVCVLISYAYSSRLLVIVCNSNLNCHGNLNVSYLILYLFIIICSASNFYFVSGFYEISSLTFYANLTLLLFQFIGIYTGYILGNYYNCFSIASSLFEQDILVILSYFFNYLLSLTISLFGFFRWEVNVITSFSTSLSSVPSFLQSSSFLVVTWSLIAFLLLLF